jgi:hypothetical protein
MPETAHAFSAPGCTGAPPPVTLTGFIGPSGKDGLVRIYRDLTFRSYCDVPADALQPVDSPGDDPEAPGAFFVAADAPIAVVEAETECAEARFLSGSISHGRLGAPVPQGVAAGAEPNAICRDTANPTYCVPMCITLFTGYPTWCPPTGTQVAGANPPADAFLCITLYTAHPTSCPPTTDPQMAGVDMGKPVMAGPYCITLWTANPSWCPPTTTTATALQAGPPICITLWTAYPSWCPATCNNTGVPTSCG